MKRNITTKFHLFNESSDSLPMEEGENIDMLAKEMVNKAKETERWKRKRIPNTKKSKLNTPDWEIIRDLLVITSEVEHIKDMEARHLAWNEKAKEVMESHQFLLWWYYDLFKSLDEAGYPILDLYYEEYYATPNNIDRWITGCGLG